jgi:hypothetical protein
MANRKTRKVTPRNRTSKPLAADLPLSSAIKKEATSILRVFDEPTEEACGAAREALRTIIEMTRDENVSAKDSLFFILGIALSGKTLPGYATLDYDHICDIRRVLEAIKRYQEDESQKLTCPPTLVQS